MDPRIYLAIDNCFAVKKWTTPTEWSRVIRGMGLSYAECVTDVDMDPLLMDAGYLSDWADEVAALKKSGDMNIVMLYTGNSTYDTTGMAHPDPKVRDRIVYVWFKKLMELAVRLDVPVGYYVQAFSDYILQDKGLYRQAMDNMMESTVKLNRQAGEMGVRYLAIEQMYTPHQVPFTIDATAEMMKRVMRESGKAFYFTEDVGHHCLLYTRPDAQKIKAAHRRYLRDGFVELWLGHKDAYDIFTNPVYRDGLSAGAVDEILRLTDEYAYLFSPEKDTSCYEWLREIGCYSPVIHLQQTNGNSSAHRPFTEENNKQGIIHPAKILKSLQKSYERDDDPALPPKCGDIYLTFELYGSTRDIGYQLLFDIEKSVEYWRRFIPEDGMRLSELVERNG